ncbi:solute carrier organic anion transporter family member 5A1-like [Diadema setosum]|uniref:solute carrier organic anion transporter family member 5A1-like n=1 Tax=Diadema setosum TaxID=31175 RepID=UPI003B3A5394
MSYFKLDFTVMESDPDLSSTNELSDEDEVDTLLDRLPPQPVDRTHQARKGSRVIKPKERKHILLLLVTALVFSTQFACRGYLNGVLSTIQHSLDISQVEAWLIDIAFDFGVVLGVTLLLVCRRCVNRPRCVAGGSFLVGVGLFASSIPYFSLHPPSAWLSSPVASNSPQYEICVQGRVPDDDGGEDGSEDELEKYINSLSGKEVAVICGMFVAGLGAAPQWVCGLTYLWDRTQKHPIVIVAFYLSASVLGQWTGEILSFIIESKTEQHNSYGAVSRWWLGFLLIGLIEFVTALLLVMYNDVPEGGKPVEQNTQRDRLASESSTLGNNEQTSAIGSPLGAPDQNDSFYYMRLDDVGNMPTTRHVQFTETCCTVYRQSNLVLLCLAVSFEAAILVGVLIFQPRFYGIMSGVGIFHANFYFSSAVFIGLLVGIVIGLAVLLLMKPSVTHMWRMTWIVCIVTMGIMWVLFLYSCDEAPVNAYTESPGTQTGADDLSRWIDLNQTCSETCGCPNNIWHPVCGSDHVTYISPCLAGCRELTGTGKINFTKCLCIEDSEGNMGSATSDPCPADCNPLWSHMMALFVIFLLTGVNFPVILLLITGTVPKEKRSQSLGMLVMSWHLIGVLPAFGFFNAILGQACSLWQSQHEFPGQHYRDCLMYHPGKHHFFFVSLVVFLKAIALAFYAISYRAAVKQQKEEADIASSRNWIGYNGARASVELGRVDQRGNASVSRSPTFL